MPESAPSTTQAYPCLPETNAAERRMGRNEETHRELGTHKHVFLFLLKTNLKRVHDVPVGQS
jgi:hypothetical protein